MISLVFCCIETRCPATAASLRDITVKDCKIEQISLHDAITALFSENNLTIPLCQELLMTHDGSDVFPTVSIVLHGTQLDDALNQLFKQAPQFGWSEDTESGIVNIFPKSGDVGVKLFSEVIQNIDYKGVNVCDVVKHIVDAAKAQNPRLYGALKVELFWTEVDPNGVEMKELVKNLPRLNIQRKNASLREILNVFCIRDKSTWTALISPDKDRKYAIAIGVNKGAVREPVKPSARDLTEAMAQIKEEAVLAQLRSGDNKLLAKLTQHKVPAVRQVALVNLLLGSHEALFDKEKAAPVEKIMTLCLSDNDVSVRYEALNSLRHLEEALARMEKEPSKELDASAQRTLATIKSTKQVGTLMGFLRNDSSYVQEETAQRVASLLTDNAGTLPTGGAEKLYSDLVAAFRDCKSTRVKLKLIIAMESLADVM